MEDRYPYARGLKPRKQIQGVLSFPAGNPVTHPALEAKNSPVPVRLKPLGRVENYKEQKGKDGDGNLTMYKNKRAVNNWTVQLQSTRNGARMQQQGPTEQT